MNYKVVSIFAVLLIALVGVAGAVYFYSIDASPVAVVPVTPVVCTEEAKICPDGSSVGRTGPKCEFTDCPESPSSDMSKWNWVLSEVSPQGAQFSYPKPVPTTYVTTQYWPPVVTMTSEDFSCKEGSALNSDGKQAQFARKTIGGSLYCVATSAEGAAGSTYTSYEYATTQGDFLTKVSFTLRTPQCMNYDEPEQSACKTDQASFNVDALADRIASSLKML
jgi:hypothetical protein